MQPTHVRIMAGWIGQRETGGPNRSPLIDRMVRRLGVRLGSSYCAAAVSLALDSAQVRTPTVRTAVAQKFRTDESYRAADVLAGRHTVEVGDLVIWGYGRSWRGHIGVVEVVVDRRTLITIEANTSCAGNGSERDGDGVCRKRRQIQPWNYFAIKWFTPVTY